MYDWEDKKQICYQLYVEQKDSMEDIMTYMREHYGFEPRYVRFGRGAEVQHHYGVPILSKYKIDQRHHVAGVLFSRISR